MILQDEWYYMSFDKNTYTFVVFVVNTLTKLGAVASHHSLKAFLSNPYGYAINQCKFNKLIPDFLSFSILLLYLIWIVHSIMPDDNMWLLALTNQYVCQKRQIKLLQEM